MVSLQKTRLEIPITTEATWYKIEKRLRDPLHYNNIAMKQERAAITF